MKLLSKGTNTKLLILSGMHGDEHEVIPHVSSVITSRIEQLPDFIYIPEVSPSAVDLKSRSNTYGHDINRCFVDPINDPEALQICDHISNLSQVISLDFHEDSSHENTFYFYDTGEMSKELLDAFRDIILHSGVSLFDGIDDSEDPALGCVVDKGYVARGHDMDSHESGFLTKWMIHKGMLSRGFTFEIPGKAEDSKKGELIKSIFSFFIDRRFMIQ